MSFLAKFFQVIEFTGMIIFFNVSYDPILSNLLEMVANLTEISFLEFPSSMSGDLSNSEAGRWTGKLSQEQVPPWIIMEIGFKGVLLLVIFTVRLAFVFLGINNKWRDRVSLMQTNMASANVMDFVGLAIRCLNAGGRTKMDGFLKGFSFLVSMIFVTVFTFEFIQQYIQVERLAKIEKSALTEHDKKLSDIYFDGMNRQDVSSSWVVRHFNLIFVLQLVLIVVFIFSMQYL